MMQIQFRLKEGIISKPLSDNLSYSEAVITVILFISVLPVEFFDFMLKRLPFSYSYTASK